MTLLAEHLQEMQSDFAAWMSKVWMPWSERERPVRKSIGLYNALFRIYSAIHAAEGVPPEVIWGFGIGIWNTQGQSVEMPLVEQEVEIEVVLGGDIVVTPRDRSLDLNLKPYLQLEIAGSARLQAKLSELLSTVRQGEASVSPGEFSALDPILETAAAELDSGGRYLKPRESSGNKELAEERLKVLGRWAIYVRPRSSAARVQDIESLALAVEEAGKPPAALKGFVAPEPDKATTANPFGLDTVALGAAGTPNASAEYVRQEPGMRSDGQALVQEAQAAEAYFFPLPFNKEQARIIDMLEGRGTGKQEVVVSVTGPPGTGKSHTIANLISHAMARGKRVLVTARTAEAISVVRDKLPKRLRSLVIASTGTDRESTELLKAAVSELSDEVVSLDVEMAERERNDLEAKILDCDRVAWEADERLAEIARANLERIRVGDVSMTPMELAPLVATGRAVHGWFVDRPKAPPNAGLEPTLERLRKALPELAPDMALIGVQVPDAAEVPGARELIEAHGEEAARAARPVLDPSAYPPMVVDSAMDLARARDLLSRLRAALREISALDVDALTLFRASCQLDRRDYMERAQHLLGMLVLDPAFDQVEYGRIVPLADLIGAAERGASGQKPAPGLFNRALKMAVAEVRVAGTAPKDTGEWKLALGAMRLEAEGPKIKETLEGLPKGTDWVRDAAWGWEWSRSLRYLKSRLDEVLELSARFRGFATEAKAFFPVGMDLEPVTRARPRNWHRQLTPTHPKEHRRPTQRRSCASLEAAVRTSYSSDSKHLVKLSGWAKPIHRIWCGNGLRSPLSSSVCWSSSWSAAGSGVGLGFACESGGAELDAAHQNRSGRGGYTYPG